MSHLGLLFPIYETNYQPVICLQQKNTRLKNRGFGLQGHL